MPISKLPCDDSIHTRWSFHDSTSELQCGHNIHTRYWETNNAMILYQKIHAVTTSISDSEKIIMPWFYVKTSIDHSIRSRGRGHVNILCHNSIDHSIRSRRDNHATILHHNFHVIVEYMPHSEKITCQDSTSKHPWHQNKHANLCTWIPYQRHGYFHHQRWSRIQMSSRMGDNQLIVLHHNRSCWRGKNSCIAAIYDTMIVCVCHNSVVAGTWWAW